MPSLHSFPRVLRLSAALFATAAFAHAAEAQGRAARIDGIVSDFLRVTRAGRTYLQIRARAEPQE